MATIGNPVVFKCFHSGPVYWMFDGHNNLHNALTLEDGQILVLINVNYTSRGKYSCHSYWYKSSDAGKLSILGKLNTFSLCDLQNLKM